VAAGQTYLLPDSGRVSALDIETRLAANPRVEKISINLNSPGGDVLQAQRIYNALRSHGAFVQVTVDRQCASAANQILLAGDLRQAWFGSEIMLHSTEITPASGTRLTAETHRRLAFEVEKTNGLIIDLCVARTGTARARFEREFRDEKSMTLSTAISLGLIHAKVGDVPLWADFVAKVI
jgi:ATP-dependent protease ClpP protease subunit